MFDWLNPNVAQLSGLVLSAGMMTYSAGRWAYYLLTRRGPDQDLIDALTACAKSRGNLVRYDRSTAEWSMILHTPFYSAPVDVADGADLGNGSTVELRIPTDNRPMTVEPYGDDELSLAVPIVSRKLRRIAVANCVSACRRHIDQTLADFISAHKKGGEDCA